MTKPLYLLLLLVITTFTSYAQKTSHALELQVLQHNQVGKEYKFKTEDHTVTFLKYLGQVYTLKGNSYKVLTSVWSWGLSHRATSRILIYTDRNRYVGNYYVTTKDEIPDYIKDNKLVFLNEIGDYKPRITTYVDFSKGIPKLLYNECAGNQYEFDRN